ncbi:phosphoglycerate dehydrogenase [Terrimicrobium sacchariphilum]|uniref:Phosphoglycerate dehydrogenase n=1 Tax=Terrimicrobium sacchariphilum TaxID=690879 RepID=A0A146G4K5_TERSA|nr:hydroxyacid dehydrogenase [Terrimicrobium sacchariphilum]GAT32531.1 phosphoglycerate dehydrogenase [Terrimicrobium sacchariphilum]
MKTLDQSQPSPASATACRTERLLFAISRREQELFLPGLDPDAMGEVAVEWYDPLDTTEPWPRVLRRFQPTIIIACWSTPLLPEPAAGQPLPRYVCHLAGSVRNVVPRWFIEQGGLVSNWGSAVCEQVAEQALLLALAALRNVSDWHSYIRDYGPLRANPALVLRTKSLYGRRVGIHGFGRIARALLDLLHPFRVDVAVYSDGVPPECILAHGATPLPSLGELFAQSEILFECEALTPHTQLSVTRNLLASLPDDAVFVNVGRGLTVDEAALKQEAASGRLRVALDVVHEEPVTSRTEMFSVNSAILSPHIGGPTSDEHPRCGEFALSNIQRYLAGEPVHARITLETFDRST